MKVEKTGEMVKVIRSYRVSDTPEIEHWSGRQAQPFQVRTTHLGEIAATVRIEVDAYELKEDGTPGQREVRMAYYSNWSDTPGWLKTFANPDGYRPEGS